MQKRGPEVLGNARKNKERKLPAPNQSQYRFGQDGTSGGDKQQEDE